MINLEKEIREQPQVLASLKEKNKAVLTSLVEEIKAKKIDNIYFVARGTSDHACIYAQYLFGVVLGIPCSLALPSVFTQYGAKINFNNSLVVGVSQSGKAEDVNAVLESANEQGMTTLAITNYETSLIANTAKYHLFCNANEEKSIAATKTFTAQMYLLALLCAEWSGNSDLIRQFARETDFGHDDVVDLAIKNASYIGKICNAELEEPARRIPVFDKYDEFIQLFDEVDWS